LKQKQAERYWNQTQLHFKKWDFSFEQPSSSTLLQWTFSSFWNFYLVVAFFFLLLLFWSVLDLTNQTSQKYEKRKNKYILYCFFFKKKVWDGVENDDFCCCCFFSVVINCKNLFFCLYKALYPFLECIVSTISFLKKSKLISMNNNMILLFSVASKKDRDLFFLA